MQYTLDMRQSINHCATVPVKLVQEARNRRLREAPSAAPADPSRAAEMDNASFVATLPPELRREVLLSADDALLNTLPPNLVAEAMVMRERIPHQVMKYNFPVWKLFSYRGFLLCKYFAKMKNKSIMFLGGFVQTADVPTVALTSTCLLWRLS